MAFWTIILFAATMVLSELFKRPPRTENARPADMGDFSFPTATEGRVVPIFWGTCLLDGPNVVWTDDLRPQAITNKVKTSMFSSKRVVVGHRYRIGIQMAFSRGPIDAMLRILVDDKELWSGNQTSDGSISINQPNFFGGEEQGQGGIVGTVTVRIGSSSQTVPAYLSQFQQVGGQTPAYRGTFYLLLERVLLGTSTSVRPWSVEARRIPNGLGLSSGNAALNGGNDANPMNVIYEVMTNTEWGFGFAPADIDTVNFAAVAAVLASEGNGISWLIDADTEASDILDEIQRQIDGVVYIDRATGLFVCKLARADYSIWSVPLADPSNVISVQNFTRGAWAETQNIVNVQFHARNRDYQVTYAGAQDLANMRNQGGQIVKSDLRFPGVKDSELANQIAWRELRASSYPLAKAKLVVNREFYGVNQGDVIAWTDPDLGITTMPMRVLRADFGEIDNGRISLDLIQDVFAAVVPSSSSPNPGEWTPPANEIVNIPDTDRLMFEAPRAFVDRDLFLPGVGDRVWAGFRSQGDGAASVSLRNNTGQAEVGTVASFLLAGELTSSLAAAHATSATIQITATPDTKGEILSMLETATAADIGISLSNLCMVGDEFIAFTGVSDPGGSNINLTGCIRGLLDSTPPPAGHSAGARVWMVHLGGALTDSAFPGSGSISIRPIGEGLQGELAWASATATSVTLAQRDRRPYPPINPRSGANAAYNGTFSIDQASIVAGTGDNARGTPLSFTRRDYRQGNEWNKVNGESALPADFPAANTTEYRLEVRADPQGTNTLLYQGDWGSSNSHGVSRNQVLAANAGAVPARIRASILARHVDGGSTLEAGVLLSADWDVTSGLNSLSNLGSLNTNAASAVYSAPTTGTYNLNIGDAMPAGAVQYRLNGGAWTTVISGVSTTGSFSATAGDDIEVRHTGSVTPDQYRFLAIDAPSSSADAYAILVL